jgi:hypothetical protein
MKRVTTGEEGKAEEGKVEEVAMEAMNRKKMTETRRTQPRLATTKSQRYPPALRVLHRLLAPAQVVLPQRRIVEWAVPCHTVQ